MTRQYANPNAFKDALKARVKRRARETGRLFNRALQIELFDRFLAGVYAALGDAVILKGGYAMEPRSGVSTLESSSFQFSTESLRSLRTFFECWRGRVSASRC